MYAILEFDQMGLKDVDFRRVDYDVQKRTATRKDLHLPYYQVYYESLVMAFIIPTIMSFFMRLSREKVMIEKSMLG